MNKEILTIDIGGTKTRIVSFHSQYATLDKIFTAPIAEEFEFPTSGNQDVFFKVLIKHIRDNFPNFTDGIISVVARGVVRDNLLNSKLLGWKNFAIVQKLRKEFPNTDIFTLNDAKAGTLGVFEPNFRGRGLYVAIGTGIGCGLIIDGQLSYDLIDMEAGKIHLRLPDGRLSSWENIASGNAFVKNYGAYPSEIVDDNPIWREYADNVTLGLYALIPVLFPVDKIVFGGGISNSFSKFGHYVAENLQSDAIDKRWFETEISVAANLDYAVNRGAAIFALSQSVSNE